MLKKVIDRNLLVLCMVALFLVGLVLGMEVMRNLRDYEFFMNPGSSRERKIVMGDDFKEDSKALPEIFYGSKERK